MTDILTTANKVAARLSERRGEEPTDESQSTTSMGDAAAGSSTSSPLKKYAKRAAILGAISLGRRLLSEDRNETTESVVRDADATRVEVVDPAERASETESEESDGGLFSLKRLLFVGALAGAGYVAVKKLRSKSGEQQTLEEWDARQDESSSTESESESPTHVDVATGDEADADVETTAAGAGDTPVPDAEKGQEASETDDDGTEDVDIGADPHEVDPPHGGDAEEDISADDVDTDESVDATDAVEVKDQEDVEGEPGEVAVDEEVVDEVEGDHDDDDEDERLTE